MDSTRAARAPQVPLDVVAVIAAGGAIGGGGRWLVNHALPVEPDSIPWATVTENVTGCLLLGGLLVLLLEFGRPGRYARPFWGVGVLGGYTTFSTFSADAVALIRQGTAHLALAYVAGTLLAGLAATWVGQAIARAIIRGRTR